MERLVEVGRVYKSGKQNEFIYKQNMNHFKYL